MTVRNGKTTLNTGRTIRLVADHTRLTHFVHYLIAFGSQPEATSDVISGKFVKFALGGWHFRRFYRDIFRPEVVSDVTA